MAGWKQISGDVNWSGVGVVLAKDDPEHESVELVKIEPWAEHDKSAEISHGLYIVDSGYFDYDELDVGKKNIKDVMKYIGADAEDWKEMGMPHRAEALASYQGYGGESSSTNNLLGALPDKPENIEFWGGKETEESVNNDNASMRREALERHFDTMLDGGEVPEKGALEYAMDGEGLDVELSGDEERAFSYAMVMAGLKRHGPKVHLDGPKDVGEVAVALWNAPSEEDLLASKSNLARAANMLGLEGEDNDVVAYEAGKLAEEAQQIGVSIMESLGFDWR